MKDSGTQELSNLESKSLLYHAKEEHQAELAKMQGQVSTTKHPRNSIRDTTLRLQTNSQMQLREGLKHPNLSCIYTKIEGLFKAAADGHLPNNDTIQEIGDHLGDDLQGEELPVELLMLKKSFQAMHFTMKN